MEDLKKEEKKTLAKNSTSLPPNGGRKEDFFRTTVEHIKPSS